MSVDGFRNNEKRVETGSVILVRRCSEFVLAIGEVRLNRVAWVHRFHVWFGMNPCGQGRQGGGCHQRRSPREPTATEEWTSRTEPRGAVSPEVAKRPAGWETDPWFQVPASLLRCRGVEQGGGPGRSDYILNCDQPACLAPHKSQPLQNPLSLGYLEGIVPRFYMSQPPPQFGMSSVVRGRKTRRRAPISDPE